MRAVMRRAVTVSAVAAVSTVVPVPAASAATNELSGFCRVDGYRGHTKMAYVQDDGVYRPTQIVAGTGPHLGDIVPLSTGARLRITHVPAGSVTETVDFDRTRPRLPDGATVSEPVGGVEVPATATMRLKVTFTFVKPGGDKAMCSVVDDV
jgi:hypothetical protein